MDDTTQRGSGYPSDPPPYAPPYAGSPYGGAPGYPVYEPPVSQPPRQNKSRGWIIALVIVGLFVCGIIAACAWMGSLIGGGVGTPVISGNAIAVIHLEGVIAGTSGSFSGGTATPERILSQLRRAENDVRVKAVLLRVDSPGGTVAASEEIATEVARLDKPVIVSIGDVGASGAYMVSSQADWIVAAPGSDVGSIGVILEVANLQGLLDKLGVKFAVITAGKYKDIGSPYRSLTATETKMLQQQVDLVYGQFIDYVAEGRGMSKADVTKLATGMSWAGTQAKDYGLVDEIGTYNDAVTKAASLGKIRGKAQLIEYDQTAYIDLLDALLGISSKLGTINDALTTGAAAGGDAAGRPLTR